MVNVLPRMPEVDVPTDVEARFAKAWRVASGLGTPAPFAGAVISQRYIVIMTPGRTLMIQPCPPPNSMSPQHVQAIEKIAPAGSPLNIAVIAFTQLDSLMETERKAIPFFGYLLRLSYLGHTVVVFEGHPTAFKAGCRNADLLIVDAAMVPHLQGDWMAAAWSVMRRGRGHPGVRQRREGEAPEASGEVKAVRKYGRRSPAGFSPSLALAAGAYRLSAVLRSYPRSTPDEPSASTCASV